VRYTLLSTIVAILSATSCASTGPGSAPPADVRLFAHGIDVRLSLVPDWVVLEVDPKLEALAGHGDALSVLSEDLGRDPNLVIGAARRGLFVGGAGMPVPGGFSSLIEVRSYPTGKYFEFATGAEYLEHALPVDLSGNFSGVVRTGEIELRDLGGLSFHHARGVLTVSDFQMQLVYYARRCGTAILEVSGYADSHEGLRAADRLLESFRFSPGTCRDEHS
jgi:hypothetical protein